MQTSQPSDQELLSSARDALHGGRHDQAVSAYRECIERGMPVANELAGLYYTLGNFAQALAVLDQALAPDPSRTDWRFLRGLVLLSLGDALQACSDFDAAVAAMPNMAQAYYQRGVARLRLDRINEALSDFIEATRLQPSAADAWANAGSLYLRSGNASAAVEALRMAQKLAPSRLDVLHSLANAHDALGQLDSALRLYADLEARLPVAPELLTDHALCLLRDGQTEAAYRRYSAALAISPSDQTALAGIYMAANELALTQKVDLLMDYERLIDVTDAGFADKLDVGALRAAVEGHPGLSWEPPGRSTTGGQQSTMLDLRVGSAFHEFGTVATAYVEERIGQLRRTEELAEHPWMLSCPDRWRLQAWATILHHGGHQTPHIHPAGWMSGVFYLNVGLPQGNNEGAIVFGHPQTEVGLQVAPRKWIHNPESGQFLSFPSYFFHHTVPYHGSIPRISLAFDVIPT